MVHVSSHSRQRQNVVTVMVFASVSMILPLQNGHLVGRVTASLSRDSDILPVSGVGSPRHRAVARRRFE
jgi:hypothetical protein